ncbi:MAG: DUF2089 domain-containing protein [FCB group bacterium]|nr:DUF2089 domain-containing protein [FCB group bacterium]
MTTFRLQVLDMVANEKITVDEAIRLLKVLGKTAGGHIRSGSNQFLPGKSEVEGMMDYLIPQMPDQVCFDNLLLK